MAHWNYHPSWPVMNLRLVVFAFVLGRMLCWEDHDSSRIGVANTRPFISRLPSDLDFSVERIGRTTSCWYSIAFSYPVILSLE